MSKTGIARIQAVRLLTLLLALAALFLHIAPAGAQAPPLWNGLRPGSHQVGFRTLYLADVTRPWLTAGATADASERAARPVRVSLWYPATIRSSARAITYRDYVELPPPPRAFQRLSDALEARNLASLRQVVRGPEALERLLGTTVLAYRDARPAAGRFPLVVYVSGLNESGQHANSVLAEYLASRGFVVAAIAQTGGTPARLRLGINPVDLETQVRDVEFAAAELRALPFVEPRWAVVGHSMGGMVAMLAQSRNPDLAAVVGLDASYGSRGLQSNLTASPFFRPERMRVPLLDLRRADPPADFSVVESLIHADRYIGEFPNIAHGDFTSFPMIATLVPVDIQGRTVEDARRGHELIIRTVATFLEAVLNRDRGALAALQAPAQGAVMRWRTAAAVAAPPTEEEFVRAVLDRGVDSALETYRRFRALDLGRPLLNERLILSMGYDFLEPGGDPRHAVEIFLFLTAIRPASADFLDSLAEAQIAAGQPELARATSARVLAALDADGSLSDEQRAQLRETAHQRLRDLPR